MEVHDELGSQRAQRQGPVRRDAVRVTRVVQHITESDTRGHHVLEDRDEGGHRVDVTAGEQHPAHQLGDLGAQLFVHHGGEPEIEAIEQLVALARAIAAPVPPAGLGIGGRSARLEGRTGERLDVGPVDGQRTRRVFVFGRHTRFDEGVDEALQLLAGHPVGVLLRKGFDEESEGAFHLAVGQKMRAALPYNHHPETPPLVLAERAQRGVDAGQRGQALCRPAVCAR